MNIALLGSRGLIGQYYHRCLHRHPWFQLISVDTVERAAMFPLVFSALPESIARTMEPQLLKAGCRIISSASTFRSDPQVPIFIPEVNPEQLSLIENKHSWVITKPNCTVSTFILPLTPIHQRFGVTDLYVTSLQSLSGGGKKALNDPRLLAGVSASIPQEEHKCIEEPKKIWGAPHLHISAQCNRIPAMYGHVVSISVRLKQKALLEEILECWQSFSPLTLPSSPFPLIRYHDEDLPLLSDSHMEVHCARLTRCPLLDFRFVAGAHNLIRGGAGMGCLIAEYLYEKGLINA